MKKKFFLFLFLSYLNVFCAEQSEPKRQYFKLIGGYEKYIGIVVIVAMEDIQSDVHPRTEHWHDISIKRYFSLVPEPPKEGKIYMGALSSHQQSYLFHESWLEEIDQKQAYVKYCIQSNQNQFLPQSSKYFKIIGGYQSLKNKIALVCEYGNHLSDVNEYLNKEYLNSNPPRNGKIFYGGALSKKSFFHESWLEDIDQKIAKEQFEKQLEEEILTNPNYFK